ncbi:MAG: hypothetical protein LBI36_03425 [Oscillospiraceae bacterium]|jgi:hypothetical protein|nr:hypothetical protein [Oscillospiraceae bacterium]
MADIKRLESELKKLRRELDDYRAASKKRLDALSGGQLIIGGERVPSEGGLSAFDGAEGEIRRQMAGIKQKYSALEQELKRLYEIEARENALALAQVRENARVTAAERERERKQAEDALNDILIYFENASDKYPFGKFMPGAVTHYKSAAEELKGFYKNALYQSVIGAAAGLKLRIDLDIEEIVRLGERHKSYSDILFERANELREIFAKIERVDGLSGAFYEDEGKVFTGEALDYWTNGVYSETANETREILDCVKSADTGGKTADVYKKCEILRKNADRLSKARDDFINAVRAYDERMYVIAPNVEGVMNSIGYECDDWYFFRADNAGEGAAGKKDDFRMVFGAFAVDIFPILNKAESRYENHIGIEVDERVYGANAGSVAESLKNAVKTVFGGEVISDYAKSADAAQKTRAVLAKMINSKGVTAGAFMRSVT